MKCKELITKIMTAEVNSAQVGQSVSHVRKLLAENPYRHLPVVDGTRLVGIVSNTDIDIYGTDNRTMDAVLDEQFKLEDVMSHTVYTIKNTQTVRDASELLGQANFNELPVVDDKNNLVGIVTSTDLINYLLAQY